MLLLQFCKMTSRSRVHKVKDAWITFRIMPCYYFYEYHSLIHLFFFFFFFFAICSRCVYHYGAILLIHWDLVSVVFEDDGMSDLATILCAKMNKSNKSIKDRSQTLVRGAWCKQISPWRIFKAPFCTVKFVRVPLFPQGK